MLASAKGHLVLVNFISDRGADFHAVDDFQWNSLMYACRFGHQSLVSMFLDRGVNLDVTNSAGRPALHHAATHDYPEICLLLISRCADLMAVDNNNRTALDEYGQGLDRNPLTHPRPRLRNTIKDERRELLINAFKNGPFLLQKTRDSNWQRRLPFMTVMVGCGFHPLVYNQLTTLLTLDTSVSIPDELTETEEQRRALLQLKVFGNEGIMRIIAAYL